MTISGQLERVTESGKKDLTNAASYLEELADGIGLFVGKELGEDRLRYWIDPSGSGEFLVNWDYFIHLVENLLTPLKMIEVKLYSEVGEGTKKQIANNIQRLMGFTSEVLEMFDERAIYIQGGSFGFPNVFVFRDAKSLREKAGMLRRELENETVSDTGLKAAANALFGYYESMKPGYNEAYQMAAKRAKNMGILFLEMASDRQLKDAMDRPEAAGLSSRGYALYLGRSMGARRNHFWRESGTDKYVVSTRHLMHEISNLLSQLSGYMKPIEKVRSSLESLDGILGENFIIYATGRFSETTLGVSNTQIFQDVSILKARTGVLLKSFDDQAKFAEKAGNLLKAFYEMRARYRVVETRT
ncbi:hypothetical protein HYY71_02915 [Candidatus Woesearchaeota archaeon]|nr:hypothetical protein [Candidatus Woesearchaeota archaeon]